MAKPALHAFVPSGSFSSVGGGPREICVACGLFAEWHPPVAECLYATEVLQRQPEPFTEGVLRRGWGAPILLGEGDLLLDQETPTHPFGLSIDIRGLWSPRQAARVIAALWFECERRSLTLETLDVTSHADGRPRVLIVLRPPSGVGLSRGSFVMEP